MVWNFAYYSVLEVLIEPNCLNDVTVKRLRFINFSLDIRNAFNQQISLVTTLLSLAPEPNLDHVLHSSPQLLLGIRAPFPESVLQQVVDNTARFVNLGRLKPGVINCCGFSGGHPAWKNKKWRVSWNGKKLTLAAHFHGEFCILQLILYDILTFLKPTWIFKWIKRDLSWFVSMDNNRSHRIIPNILQLPSELTGWDISGRKIEEAI